MVIDRWINILASLVSPSAYRIRYKSTLTFYKWRSVPTSSALASNCAQMSPVMNATSSNNKRHQSDYHNPNLICKILPRHLFSTRGWLLYAGFNSDKRHVNRTQAAVWKYNGSKREAPIITLSATTQQTRNIEPVLVQCWASVADDGPTVNQHSLNVPSLLGIVLLVDIITVILNEILKCLVSR